MNHAEYKRMTLVQMKTRRWVTTRGLRNGNVVIPAGTEVTVYDKINGFSIQAAECQHCGISARMTRVAPGDLREVKA